MYSNHSSLSQSKLRIWTTFAFTPKSSIRKHQNTHLLLSLSSHTRAHPVLFTFCHCQVRQANPLFSQCFCALDEKLSNANRMCRSIGDNTFSAQLYFQWNALFNYSAPYAWDRIVIIISNGSDFFQTHRKFAVVFHSSIVSYELFEKLLLFGTSFVHINVCVCLYSSVRVCVGVCILLADFKYM